MNDSAKSLLLLGAGGHGKVVFDAAGLGGQWREVLVTDQDSRKWGGELLPGVPIRPSPALERCGAVHVAIGDNAARERVSAPIGAGRLATVLHPRASVADAADIGAGTFVAAGAIVAPSARVGLGCIINHAAVVDHDCEVAAFCHLAPGAVLGGGVRLGPRVLVGSGAVVVPGISIAADVTVGAGAVVVRSIQEAGVYVGVPVRRVA